jgi:Ner family transcriptional regulator
MTQSPPVQNVHPEDVKAAVRKTGVSLAELARRNGMAPVTGRRCLYEPCPTMNRHIADHLGVPVHKLWPEWFAADGARIHRFRREASSPARAGHRQKRRVA